MKTSAAQVAAVQETRGVMARISAGHWPGTVAFRLRPTDPPASTPYYGATARSGSANTYTALGRPPPTGAARYCRPSTA